jgi:TonB family protein
MREAGSPLVHVCVGPDGEVADEPTIVTSSGSARLDAGALQLAKAGHYNPGTEDAKPVTACINMAVKFQLRKSP